MVQTQAFTSHKIARNVSTPNTPLLHMLEVRGRVLTRQEQPSTFSSPLTSVGHVYSVHSVKPPDQACFWFELQSYSAICTGGGVCLACATLACCPCALLSDFQEAGPVTNHPPRATQELTEKK